MTQKAVYQRRFQNLYIAEKIRARDTEKTDEDMSRTARQRMTEELETPEIREGR